MAISMHFRLTGCGPSRMGFSRFCSRTIRISSMRFASRGIFRTTRPRSSNRLSMPTPRTLLDRDLLYRDLLFQTLICAGCARLEGKRIDHALVEGSAEPDCLRHSNPKDHKGHADGLGREIAAHADGGRSGAALRRADGKGFDQS